MEPDKTKEFVLRVGNRFTSETKRMHPQEASIRNAKFRKDYLVERHDGHRLKRWEEAVLETFVVTIEGSEPIILKARNASEMTGIVRAEQATEHLPDGAFDIEQLNAPKKNSEESCESGLTLQ